LYKIQESMTVKTLSVSDVRNHLPSVIDEVSLSNEAVIIARYGKPIAKIVPFKAGKAGETCYPLRGAPVSVSPDFDEPTPDLWQALAVAEGRDEYRADGAGRSTGRSRTRRRGKGKPGKGTER